MAANHPIRGSNSELLGRFQTWNHPATPLQPILSSQSSSLLTGSLFCSIVFHMPEQFKFQGTLRQNRDRRRELGLCIDCGVELAYAPYTKCSRCLDRRGVTLTARRRPHRRVKPIELPTESFHPRYGPVYALWSLKRGPINPPEQLEPALEKQIQELWSWLESRQVQFKPCKLRTATPSQGLSR